MPFIFKSKQEINPCTWSTSYFSRKPSNKVSKNSLLNSKKVSAVVVCKQNKLCVYLVVNVLTR